MSRRVCWTAYRLANDKNQRDRFFRSTHYYKYFRSRIRNNTYSLTGKTDKSLNIIFCSVPVVPRFGITKNIIIYNYWCCFCCENPCGPDRWIEAKTTTYVHRRWRPVNKRTRRSVARPESIILVVVNFKRFPNVRFILINRWSTFVQPGEDENLEFRPGIVTVTVRIRLKIGHPPPHPGRATGGDLAI